MTQIPTYLAHIVPEAADERWLTVAEREGWTYGGTIADFVAFVYRLRKHALCADEIIAELRAELRKATAP